MQPERLGDVSHWYTDIGGVPSLRPGLAGDVSVDVCVVGAGYTGLWAAHYLKAADPSLNILIVEREFAGFGASGRNGGWLTGGFAWNHDRYLATSDEGSVRAMVQAMNGTVDEVIRVAEAAGINADMHRTDELMVAVNPAQLVRMQAEVVTRQGWGEDRAYAIGADALRDRVHIPGAIGAMVVGGVARVQPAKLVRGSGPDGRGGGRADCRGHHGADHRQGRGHHRPGRGARAGDPARDRRVFGTDARVAARLAAAEFSADRDRTVGRGHMGADRLAGA